MTKTLDTYLAGLGIRYQLRYLFYYCDYFMAVLIILPIY